jgi:uncharacterized protein (UPF0548 family)
MTAPLHPRWSFHQPAASDVAAFLALHTDSAEAVPFGYSEVGASFDDAKHPHGYTLDHNRERLGEGGVDFEAACAALRTWQMFPGPWTRIIPADAPIRVGNILAMQAHALGLWWLNACRIVYMIDERKSAGEPGVVRQRFGFAYGTLPAHVEQGEERFSVELRDDGSVWYDLRAFSRPRFWPVRLGKPLARRLQLRFVRESKAAMRAAVALDRALVPR